KPAACRDVDASVKVFSNDARAVSGKSLRGRVTLESRPLCRWIVDSNQSTASRSEPKPAHTIEINVPNPAWRQPVLLRKEGESSVTKTSHASIETDPDVTSTVFAERRGSNVLGRRQTGCILELTQALAAAIQAGETEGLNPYIVARVGENLRHLRIGQTIL